MLSRDKQVAQHILQKRHKYFKKSRLQTRFLSKYLGFGLLTAEGELWLRQRRLIQPAFHKERLSILMELMERTIKDELKDFPSGENIDVYPLMNRMAFRIVATSLFDLSLSGDRLERLQSIIEQIQRFIVKEIRLPHKGWWYRLSGQVDRHKALSEESRSIIRNIIEERKSADGTFSDLLQLLLDSRYADTNEPMSTEQLIDEISILFVAGHETTANALSFGLYLLASHPDVQQKVYHEVIEQGRAHSSADSLIRNSVFTRAVVQETMRLFPPAWITDRENLGDEVMGEYRLRQNTLVGVSFYELHRNPAYWEDPDEFKPERFLQPLPERSADAYFPFGAGPRMCIGMGFAMAEMVLAISTLVHRYQITTTTEKAGFEPLITLKPVGLYLQFHPR